MNKFHEEQLQQLIDSIKGILKIYKVEKKCQREIIDELEIIQEVIEDQRKKENL